MANRGEGGGSEFGPQQERLFDTQADIAEMMKGLYESRIANEEQYLGDAMSRVFQYADRMQNRSPDLLHAPGIFEFLPKGRQREGQAPEWQPFTPEGGTQPKETVNPILDDRGLRALEDLNPVTDIVPPIDMGALAGIMPWQIKKMLEGLLPGGGPKDLEEALGQEGETDTDWDAWLNDMPQTLTQIEEMMRDTLGIDKKRGAAGEAFYNPWARTYDDNLWRTAGGIERDSADLAPPGELNPGSGVRIDPVTGEVLGESFPIPDIDYDTFINAMQARGESGTQAFTNQIPGIVREPAWRSRRRDERIAQEVEEGEFIPEGDKSYPIRPVSGSDVQKLLEWATMGEGRTGGLQFVLEDGSSATGEQIMAYADGEGPPLYLRDIWTGAMLEAGYLPGPDQDDLSKNQLRLSEEEIDALLVDRSTQSSNDDVSGKTSASPIKRRR
tara:strand:- start:555 stop:1880 length:1326 start_codon:yes stop_codon:yes gene_type:complete